MAGIIAGQPGPDGFSGVAPEASLVSIRQSSAQWAPKLPAGGGDPQQIKTAGDVATLARAVRHAADIPFVRVINISLIDCIAQYKQVDQAALGAALRYATIDKDIVVVAAAGNTGESNCESNPLTDPKNPEDPRNWAGATTISTPSYWQPYVLSVASLTPEGQPSGFTMAGPWVGIGAPGEQIVSLGNAPNSGLINGQPSTKEPLVPINGTSFAAAYVSGVAALVRSEFPDLTARQVVNRIVASAHNAARSPSNLVGAGVIDPVAALTWDIPEGEKVPANMPVVRVEPPAPPPPDNRLPRMIALGAGILAVAAAVIAVTMIGMRRGNSTSRQRPRFAPAVPSWRRLTVLVSLLLLGWAALLPARPPAAVVALRDRCRVDPGLPRLMARPARVHRSAPAGHRCPSTTGASALAAPSPADLAATIHQRMRRYRRSVAPSARSTDRASPPAPPPCTHHTR